MNWREKIKSHYGEAGSQFKNLTDKDKKLYWCFYKYRIKLSIEMVYFEIFYNSHSNSIFIIGARMHANDTAAAQIIKPLISEPIKINHSGEFEIFTSSVLGGGGFDFSSSIKQSIDINTMNWKLLNISSKIRETKFARNNKTLASWNESYKHINSHDSYKENIIEVVCPACFDKGFDYSFAISKDDYNSGATGYDLYSCNTINAKIGCTNCGGSGVEYEDWYLMENPELKKSSRNLVKGRGFIDEIQMLPYQSLKTE